MSIIYYILMALVIGGYLYFAYRQWSDWPAVAAKISKLTALEAEKTEFLGRSFASYNASIGVGLLLSFLLEGSAEPWVQGVTLAAIVGTAAVGAMGTTGNLILKFRLFPAAAALAVLILWQVMV
jgi:uncharacterized membrane protein